MGRVISLDDHRDRNLYSPQDLASEFLGEVVDDMNLTRETMSEKQSLIFEKHFLLPLALGHSFSKDEIDQLRSEIVKGAEATGGEV